MQTITIIGHIDKVLDKIKELSKWGTLGQLLEAIKRGNYANN